MNTEKITPSKKHFMFLLLPIIGFEKFYSQYTFAIGWLCWGFSISIDDNNLDKFDNFMSNVFKRTNPQMWFCIIMASILLLNLCL